MRVILNKHVATRLGLVRLAGVQDDVPDSASEPLHLSPDLLSRTILRDAIDPEPPVVHRFGDHQVAARTDLEVVETFYGFFGVLWQ